MSILGIDNRTENWKTALYFSPMFRGGASRLAERLGEPDETGTVEAHLELFWYGMRDYLDKCVETKESVVEDFAQRYRRLFPNLREKIEEFQSEKGLKLQLPNQWNYDVSTKEGTTKPGVNPREKLYDNLRHTEIDVVLETPNRLIIGEAKGVTDLRGKGSWVLVHQLIRQYVMARILVDRRESDGFAKKEVVPFVVRNDPKRREQAQVVRNDPKRREQAQVSFMVKQGWLEPENILDWDHIQKLHP